MCERRPRKLREGKNPTVTNIGKKREGFSKYLARKAILLFLSIRTLLNNAVVTLEGFLNQALLKLVAPAG